MSAARLHDAVQGLMGDAAWSGVVRIDVPGSAPFVAASGLADRAHGVPMHDQTVLAVASVTKGVTALTVMRLVESGVLHLHTTARSLLGDHLPLVADDVTVEQLLSHRSGIGDYLDESEEGDIADRLPTVPTHTLAGAEDHLPLLDGYPMREPPGTAFRYNNGGYVLLGVLAERAAGRPYHDLVHELVLQPAGMQHAAFHRSDTTPGDVALQYLDADGLRTNVLHMPLRGVGDGGLHCTVADLHALWDALASGSLVREDTWNDVLRPRTRAGDGPGADDRFGYGLGMWLAANDVAFLEGYDVGISARTMYRPSDRTTMTVVSNTSEGAWPIARMLLAEITGATGQ